MTEVTIRLATSEDVPALRELVTASVRGLSVGYYSPEQIEAALVHMFGVDTQLVEDRTYYVAEADGEIVGCGGWSRRKTLFGGDQWKAGEPDALLDPERDAARIRAFFVRPDRARRGIGGRILRACETAAREQGFRRLELMATLPGEPLYAAYGYVGGERVEIPMGDGPALPGVAMSKEV